MRRAIDLMVDYLMLGLWKFGLVLVKVAVKHYMWMRRWLDYLPKDKVWKGMFVLMLGLSIPTLNIAVPLLALIVYMQKKWPYRAFPSPVTIACWEFCVWMWVFVAVIYVPYFFTGVPEGYAPAWWLVIRSLGSALCWVLAIYLYMELFTPPRKRKKVKVPSLVKAPVPSFQT